MKLPRFEELAHELAKDLTASHALGLAFGDCSIELRSNSVYLVKRLQIYFSDFLANPAKPDVIVTALEAPAWRPDLELTIKEPDPGKVKIKEEYVDLSGGRLLLKRLTGMVFLMGRGLHLAYGPCLANDNQVVNFINSRHIQWMLERGWLLCHASGVSQNTSGLALAGVSGAGKSTLALHLMNRGLDFVSNDRLLIRRYEGGLQMCGVAKLPRINPGTALNNPSLQKVMPADEAREFVTLPSEELWSLEHKYDVFIDQCFGPGRFKLASHMGGLVVLSWSRENGEPIARRVDIAERPDLLAAFMKAPGLFYLPEDPDSLPGPAEYIAALEGTRVHEIAGGVDFDQAVEACGKFMASQGNG
jgi:HprK-related kinase B